MMLTIDIDTARRFILGKQGLWPGRRWSGTEGTEQAMQAMEYLQLDPLQIIARSHDIALAVGPKSCLASTTCWEVYKPADKRKFWLLCVAGVVGRSACRPL